MHLSPRSEADRRSHQNDVLRWSKPTLTWAAYFGSSVTGVFSSSFHLDRVTGCRCPCQRGGDQRVASRRQSFCIYDKEGDNMGDREREREHGELSHCLAELPLISRSWTRRDCWRGWRSGGPCYYCLPHWRDPHRGKECTPDTAVLSHISRILSLLACPSSSHSLLDSGAALGSQNLWSFLHCDWADLRARTNVRCGTEEGGI